MRLGTTEADLRRVIKLGIPGTGMPAFGSALDEAQIDGLISHLTAWLPAASSALECKPPPVPELKSLRGAGRAIWESAGCAGCHGVDGSGSRMLGLKNPNGIEADLYDLRAPLKGGTDPENIFCAVTTGRPGTPMRGRPDLSERDRWRLVSVVLGFRKAAFHRRRRHTPDAVPAGFEPMGSHVSSTPVSAQECALCHRKEYQTWRESRHAMAMGPGVTGQYALMKKSDVARCNRCHAPFPQLGVPGEGVSCISCHAVRRVTANVQKPGHPPIPGMGADMTIGAAAQTSSQCLACHNLPLANAVEGRPLLDTWREWAASQWFARGRQCQDCHMKSGHGVPGAHSTQQVRGAVDVRLGTLKRVSGQVDLTVSITNSGAGHHFPTSATPMAIISVGQTHKGKEIPGTERSWQIARSVHFADGRWHEIQDTRIPSGARHRYAYAAERDRDADGVAVTLYFFPDWHYGSLLPRIMNRRGLSKGTLAELKRASDAADSSGFRVFYRVVPLD